MPRYKAVKSLYTIALKKTYHIIKSFCVSLQASNENNKSTILSSCNEFLCVNIPSSILDDILHFHTENDQFDFNGFNNTSASPLSYYFFKTILHSHVKKFCAKNLKLSLSYWECLFQASFLNLIELNLALSCTDDILRLISIYCPNLEYINATCRYVWLRMGSNATAFTLSVTDTGLRYLCECKKLKKITLNEPRSQRNGTRNSITYTGLRELLLKIQSIEDITYTDLGSVVSKDMEHIDYLNLRIIRHFNATETTMREILRLCTHIDEFYLTFFNTNMHDDVVKQFLTCNLKLKSIGLVRLNLDNYFITFFQKFGDNLKYLSLSNCIDTEAFSKLVIIAKCCHNLKYLKYNFSDGSQEIVDRKKIDKHLGYFSKLEDLYISGRDLDIENILILCTQNALYLENFKLTESYRTSNIDRTLLKHLNNLHLKHIEISSHLICSEVTIRMLIERFKMLGYLSIFCADNCADLKYEIIEKNYDLNFFNQKNDMFNI